MKFEVRENWAFMLEVNAKDSIFEDVVFESTGGGDPGPDVYNLIISKKVSGDFGDRNKSFEFEIKAEDDTVDFCDYTDQLSDYNFVVDSSNTNEATLSLKHGETISFENLPEGDYTVTEFDVGDYEVFYSVDENNSGSFDQNGPNQVEIDLDGDTAVTFTNRLDAPSLTGVDLGSGYGAMVLIFGGLLLFYLVFLRRRGDAV